MILQIVIVRCNQVNLARVQASQSNKSKLLLLAILVGLAACGSNPQNGAPMPISGAEPTLALSFEQAQQTAGDFLNAWAATDYESMYKLLHVKSKGATARADFEAAYTGAEQAMTVLPDGKSYNFTNAIQQGSAVQIAYDMSFKTRLFGTITDAGRVLNLEATADGWRVAWSPGDIFAEMKDGAVLDVNTVQPNRGAIYDRNGNALADQNGTQIAVTLLTEKYPTGSPDECFAQLARVFPQRDAATLKKIYGQYTGRAQAYAVGQLNNAQFIAEKPALTQVCTLTFQSSPARSYPQGGLAPHVVGYVGRIPAEKQAEYLAKGYPADALVGIDGIENTWEDVLAGQGATTLALYNHGSRLRVLAQSPGKPPQSVYLTIDSKLQLTVQNTFKEAYSSSSAYFQSSKGAAAVVMDVNTGAILAIASYPDFDVNAFNPVTPLKDAQTLIAQWAKDPRKPTFNRATLGAYPLGSVFKIVSMAAGADSGNIGLDSLYTCTGVWDGVRLGDRWRHDWIYNQGPGQHGTITLRQALTGSCDPYFWHVGWTLNGVDPHILPDYARRMGFGAPTGIKDVHENPGQVPDPDTYPETQGKKWTGSDALDFVIGQGTLLVTPLQVVRMVAGIANGGTLYQPMLVKQTGLINEPNYVATPIANGHMNLKPEVVAAIRDSMCKVTTSHPLGTATFVFVDFKDAVVCGKTGTAESGQADPHAWFAAFAGRTADKPEIAVVCIVENSYEGSYMAAPIVRRIIEAYYDIRYKDGQYYPYPAWWGPQSVKVVNGD